MPQVYNVHKWYPADCILVGRGTPFGNPYRIGRDGTREEVIEKFERWLMFPSNEPLRERIKKELEVKICYVSARHYHVMQIFYWR